MASSDYDSSSSDDAALSSCPLPDIDMEVTREQYLASLESQKHKGRKGLGSLMPSFTSRKKVAEAEPSGTGIYNNDCSSLGSDAAVQSIASFTVASTDTVKASNRAQKDSKTEETLLKKKWTQFKQHVLGLKEVPEMAGPVRMGNRAHAFSADFATSNTSKSCVPMQSKSLSCRPRLGSAEQFKRDRTTPAEQRAKQFLQDQSITCRFDGLDVISLGPAMYDCFPVDSYGRERPPARWDSLPLYDVPFTATGTPIHLPPDKMIHDMLWMSCGRELPEMILEGLVPGADDRWCVRIEQRPSTNSADANDGTRSVFGNTPTCAPLTIVQSHPSIRSIPGLSRCSSAFEPPGLIPAQSSDDCETSDEGSTNNMIPSARLWPTLWGGQSPPPYATMEAIQDDDPLMALAAENSIPIDLDENTFCVSERAHLETIHSFVAVSLSMGSFETAVKILNKVIKGAEMLKDRFPDDRQGLRFLKGSTMHNLGVVYMWMGDYESAVDQFHQAVQERRLTLPKNHPDIVVSMAREAMAQFALGRLEEALFGLQLILPMTHASSILRSKILNNIGVMHFMKQDFVAALGEFTSSLEIQRTLLECDVRRDTIVYDASTTLGNMGKLYFERRDYHLSYYVYEEAVMLQTTIFRKDHDFVLTSLTNLALIRGLNKQLKGGIQMLQGCLRSQNARFGKQSAPSIETLALMGSFYERLGCREDALKCYLPVKRWQKANLPPNHPSSKKMKLIVDENEEILGTNVAIWV